MNTDDDRIHVSGIDIEWDANVGGCKFENLPVAMMWIDTTLAGLFSAVQSMVGTQRSVLALQSEGRKSVDEDWKVISQFPDFHDGFKAIANIAAVAGWGRWQLVFLDMEKQEACFRMSNVWEATYQKALGVCWGSGFLAGKVAGYCTKLFKTNCWAEQTAYIARGDSFDEFVVKPSTRSIEIEMESLLATDEATRADMAVALRKLEKEVAERKHTEEMLRESEQRIQSIINNTDAGYYFLGKNGLFLDVNEAWLKLHGYSSKDEVLGKHFSFTQLVHDLSKATQNVEFVLQGNSIPFGEFTRKYKDGAVGYHTFSANPVIKDGQVIGLEGFIIDVTEKKQFEKHLLQAQKVEAIGALAGGIAHDFNNMLSVITGNISYALSLVDKTSELKDVLSDVQEGARQAQHLTHQLLTFAKGGEPIKKSHDINELIEKSAQFVTSGAKSQCYLKLADDSWTVEIDSSQITQVMSNMIINANQAMPEGGSVTIQTENVHVETDAHLHLPAGKYVKISIQDQGIGIQDKHLANIFDPYFTTKEEGSGLGLATAYSIIKRHDGYITVNSEVGGGTVFYIYLPASDIDICDSDKMPEPQHIGQGNILIMDDQESILRMIGRMLNQMGYKTTLASNGSEAIEKYREAYASQRPFNLVILDLTVPGGMGGAKTISGLLKIDPRVKAVVSSGYSNDPIMSNYKDHGFCAVIPKPYSRSQLAEVLKGVFETAE